MTRAYGLGTSKKRVMLWRQFPIDWDWNSHDNLDIFTCELKYPGVSSVSIW